MHIRKAILEDAPAIAKVHVDSWRTTYKGIIPQSFLDKLDYDKRTELWINNISNPINEVFVALNDDEQVVGFATGSKREKNKEADAADLTSIYLLEQWQGFGLGKLLLKAVMEDFHVKGFTKAFVEVLALNKTRAFYQYHGADYVKTEKLFIAGEILDEEIYVWNNIETVLQKIK